MRTLRQRGFSLVEIMVAITLSLIILAGVLAVMYSSKVTYMENDRVARLQESGRAALDLMLRDLRGAGFPGCAQEVDGLLAINNTLNDNEEVPWNLAEPVFGFEGTGGVWIPALDATLLPDATEDNDVLVVRTIPAGSPSFRVTTVTNPTDSIVVAKDAGEALAAGTPAVISDCNASSIFVVGAFTADADDLGATITRNTVGGPPSNSTDDLGSTFTINARVQPITSVAYYVAPDSAGTGTSLWRVVSNNAPEELIPGVEAMQLRYGVDTDSDRLITINEYVDANEIAAGDWNQVVSVSIALLVRSAEENSQTRDERTYTLLETDFAVDDFYQRSLFTTTVTLRNRTT